MRAWLMHGYDGVSGLELGEIDRPAPGEGEVLLRVSLAALNPADAYLTQKLYPARPVFPHILGRDGAGVIEEVGAGVTGLKAGDVVHVLRGEAGVNKPGLFAEFAVVPASVVAPVPKDWSLEEAAAGALVYLTAYQALTQWEPLKPGSVVVITGATGGVGVASLHLAKAMGCRVIALSRSEEKGARLLDWGAEVIFSPEDEDLKKRIREVAGKEGVSVIVDSVAGPCLPVLIDTLGYRGAVSVVGMLAGPVPKFNTAKLFFKRLRIGGVSGGDFTPTEAQETWKTIVAMMNKEGVRPVIDSVYPMEKLPDAFERLAKGPLGKVLLKA